MRTLCVTLALGLAALVALAHAVDPFGQHGSPLFEPVVWTARADKVRLLAAAQPRPRALILGSSRIMEAEPALVSARTGVPAFNAAVNSATIADFAAIAHYAVDDLACPLELLVIGIEVESLRGSAARDDRTTLVPELARHASRGGALGAAWDRWKRDLSWQALDLAVRSVAGVGRGDHPLRFAADGLLVDSPRHRERRRGGADPARALASTLPAYQARFADMHELDPTAVAALHELLAWATARGTRVAIAVTPMHRQLAEALAHTTEREHLLGELRALLAELRAEFEVDLVDFSRDPALCGDLGAFVDGVHPRLETQRAMLRRLLRER